VANELKLDNSLAKDAKPVKVGDDSTGLLLGTSSVSVVNQPTELQHITNKEYVDQFKTFRHVIHAGFNYGSTGGTKVFVPLNGYIVERTSVFSGNEYQAFATPYDGYISQVIMRSEEACGSSVVGFHVATNGNEVPSSTAVCDVTVDMASDDTAYKFDFSDVSSNDFNAGNALQVSFTPTNDANDTIFTVELILNSLAGL